MGWTRAPIRELPGERDAFRVGTVINVALIGILLVVTTVSGFVATPGAFLVAIPLAVVEAWFVGAMVRQLRRPAHARMPVDDDLAALVLVEGIERPLDPAWIAGVLRFEFDSDDDVRDAVLALVERLVRDGTVLAGRVDGGGRGRAFGDGELLETLDADGAWLHGRDTGVRLVLSPSGRRRAHALRDAPGSLWSSTGPRLLLIGDPGPAWREATDRVRSRLRAEAPHGGKLLVVALHPGDATRVGPSVTSLDALTATVGLPAAAPGTSEAALLARLAAAVDLVEDVALARGDLDEPLDDIRRLLQPDTD